MLGAPDAVADPAALPGVHHDDEIGRSGTVHAQELRPMRREIDAVTRRRGDRLGWRRASRLHGLGTQDHDFHSVTLFLRRGDVRHRQIPVREQDLEPPLFLTFVRLLVRPELTDPGFLLRIRRRRHG